MSGHGYANSLSASYDGSEVGNQHSVLDILDDAGNPVGTAGLVSYMTTGDLPAGGKEISVPDAHLRYLDTKVLDTYLLLRLTISGFCSELEGSLVTVTVGSESYYGYVDFLGNCGISSIVLVPEHSSAAGYQSQVYQSVSVHITPPHKVTLPVQTLAVTAEVEHTDTSLP